MEEQNNDFRKNVLEAYARTKSNETKEQINGYKELIDISRDRKWIIFLDIISSNIRKNKDLFSEFSSFLSENFLTEEIVKKADSMEEEYYKISNSPNENQDKITNLAERAFELGDFKLFIKMFDKTSVCFYNLGVNPFHDCLLNLLVAVILTNPDGWSHVFRKLNYDSPWEMKTYDFILSLMNKNFSVAYSYLNNLSTEIYDDLYLIIPKEKFIQICVLVYILEGGPEDKINILDNPSLLLFKHRRDPKVRTIVNAMKSFDYINTLNIFEGMIKELSSNPLLKIILNGMVIILKKKFLRYTVQHSSALYIKNLSESFRLNENHVLELILSDIENKILNVKIDLINQIVYGSKRDDLAETLKSTANSVENVYLSNYRKFQQNLSERRFNFTPEDYQKFETIN